MPSYPNFPFVPAGSDGIDDQDGLPNDWFVPADPGAVAPNNANLPAPAAAPNPPVPSPQPSAAPLGPSNQPVPPRPDPFAAFWALIPASRVGALAWAPPIFPSSNPFAFQNIPAPPPPFSLNSPRQFPSAGPAPFDDVPPAAANGLFGSTIGRMLAARAKPYDPFEAAANGMWGGIAKMIAANAAPDPGARGFLGSLADLPVPPSAQAASYAPYSGPFLQSGPGPTHRQMVACRYHGPTDVGQPRSVNKTTQTVPSLVVIPVVQNFGTPNGKPYLDHQPSKSLNPPPGAPLKATRTVCVQPSARRFGQMDLADTGKLIEILRMLLSFVEINSGRGDENAEVH